MRILEIRDDGKEYLDRYTVCYNEFASYTDDSVMSLFMNLNGSYSHGGATQGDHLGELIEFTDLPQACQQTVVFDVEDVYIDEIDAGFENEDDEPELFYQQRVNEQLCQAIKAAGKELSPMPDDE